MKKRHDCGLSFITCNIVPFYLVVYSFLVIQNFMYPKEVVFTGSGTVEILSFFFFLFFWGGGGDPLYPPLFQPAFSRIKTFAQNGVGIKGTNYQVLTLLMYSVS